jgi:hypothetical protein
VFWLLCSAQFTADKGAPVSTVNATFTAAALDKTVVSLADHMACRVRMQSLTLAVRGYQASDVDMLSMDNPYMFESNKEGKLDIADICYNFFVLNMHSGE